MIYKLEESGKFEKCEEKKPVILIGFQTHWFYETSFDFGVLAEVIYCDTSLYTLSILVFYLDHFLSSHCSLWSRVMK